MTRECDPRAMTAAERGAEIAQLLAVGYLRARTARILAQKGLDADPEPEAQCGSKVQNPQSTESAA